MGATSPVAAQELRGSARLIPLEPPEPSPIGAPPDGPAVSAESEAMPGSSQGVDVVNGGAAHAQAGVDTPAGISYSSIFRDPDRFGPGFNHQIGVNRTNSYETRSLEVGMPVVGIPFMERAFSPADAHLKMGPVYLRINSISGALLGSDNINWSETDREKGSIAQVQLGITVIAQLSEGWQFALSGAICYLPFTGDVGFGNGQLMQFLDYNQALLRSQVSKEAEIGGWTVTFSDTFEVRPSNSLYGGDDMSLFGGYTNKSSDRAGRYSFSAPKNSLNDNILSDPNSLTFYASNLIGAYATRLYPSELRVSAKATHENFWYQDQYNGYVPQSESMLAIELASERESLRFKPFCGYELDEFRYKSDSITEQQVYAGIRGPITDQLFLTARAGYLTSDLQDGNSATWRLSLEHVAGPSTTESLFCSREPNDFGGYVADHFGYRLTQGLGPHLTSELFVLSGFSGYSGANSNVNSDFRAGLQFILSLGPKTRVRLAGTYSKYDLGGDIGNVKLWTGRSDVTYRITDSLTGSLLYQYQKRISDKPGDSYYENLLLLTLSKAFP